MVSLNNIFQNSLNPSTSKAGAQYVAALMELEHKLKGILDFSKFTSLNFNEQLKIIIDQVQSQGQAKDNANGKQIVESFISIFGKTGIDKDKMLEDMNEINQIFLKLQSVKNDVSDNPLFLLNMINDNFDVLETSIFAPYANLLCLVNDAVYYGLNFLTVKTILAGNEAELSKDLSTFLSLGHTICEKVGEMHTNHDGELNLISNGLAAIMTMVQNPLALLYTPVTVSKPEIASQPEIASNSSQLSGDSSTITEDSAV